MILTLEWKQATDNFCANWLLKVGDPNPQFKGSKTFLELQQDNATDYTGNFSVTS
jgi:hypothetical protein